MWNYFHFWRWKIWQKSYVVFSPIGEVDEDGDQIYDAMAYEQNEEEGRTLLPIESEEEWEMVQEMFNTLADEQEAE